MVKACKNLTLTIVDWLHDKFFHSPMGDEMKSFIKNLGIFAFASLLTMPFLAAVNIVAGRMLGPAEYGRYALVLSIGQFLIIPMTLGMNTAIIRFTAARDNKKEIVSSGFFSILLFTVISSLFLFLTREVWVSLFRIDRVIFSFALLYAMVLACKQLSQAIMRGLHAFRLQSILEVVSAVITAMVFFGVVLFTPWRTFRIYVAAVITAFLVSSLVAFWRKRRYISHRNIRVDSFKTMLRYGLYAILGGLSGFFLGNIDRIMINHYLDSYHVGIYAAYFSASMAVVGLGFQVFLNVFFPTVSRNIDRRAVLRKIDRFFRIMTVPIIIFTFFLIWFIIFLFGAQYPIDFVFMGLFALNTGLFLVGNTKWWFIASIDTRGVRFTSAHSIVAALLNVTLNIILIRTIGLWGAICATVVSSTYLIVLSHYFFESKYAQS